MITDGQVLHTCNGKTATLSKGAACLLRPEDNHKYSFVNGKAKNETITFCLSSDICHSLLTNYGLLDDFTNSSDPSVIMADNALLDDIIKKSLLSQSLSKSAYEQYIIMIFNQLLLHFIENRINRNTAYPNWLNDFLSVLHNPSNFGKSVTELAAYTHYSYSRLIVVFQKYLRCSLSEYVRNTKITYSKSLLVNTDKSMLEISLDLGYDSVSSFNHNFKSSTGLTPLQYKKINTFNV